MRLLGASMIFGTALAGGLACSARTLIAVGPCPAGTASVDGGACLAASDAAADEAADGDAAGVDADAMADAPASTLRNGLVGLWHFDESFGAKIAADSSGNHNDGTLMLLDPATVWVSGGRVGNALAVEGLGYVQVPAAALDSIVSEVTMSAWVYFEGPVVDYATAISRQIGATLDQYYHLSLTQSDGRPYLFIAPSVDGTNLTRFGSSKAVTPKTWTHLAGTYDGTTATLYVDGTPILSMPITGTFPTDKTPLILGGNGNEKTVSELFPGRIDEIALYNRALDADEIQQLANAVSF